MRASKRRRNAQLDADHSVLQVEARPVVPTEIKIDIAHVVRTFEFSGTDWRACLERAPSNNRHVSKEIQRRNRGLLAGDWQAEMDRMYDSGTNLDDLKLGPVEWSLFPPESTMPDFAAYDQVGDYALPVITDLVDELRWRERVASHLHPNFSAIGGGRRADAI